MKENKDITWIIDCIILAIFALCMCSLTSCQDSYAEELSSTPTTRTDTLMTSAQTDSLIAETWDVEPWQVEKVNYLLNWSFQVESIYIDLLLANEALADSVDSPTHQFCLECKMKALKFCFNHRLFDDTVGEMEEMEEADWLYTLDDKLESSHPSEFALWWARIDWNY